MHWRENGFGGKMDLAGKWIWRENGFGGKRIWRENGFGGKMDLAGKGFGGKRIWRENGFGGNQSQNSNQIIKSNKDVLKTFCFLFRNFERNKLFCFS
jgi:hypothetical protein